MSAAAGLSGRILLAAIAAATLAPGCTPTAEERFTERRSFDPCVQAIPACPPLFAACVLDDARYARQRFPEAAPFRFAVYAEALDTIEVRLFFAEQQTPGLVTDLYWNEPGCSDAYHEGSDGRDLFAEAERLGYIRREAQVLEEGFHLIELFTDMTAEVLIAVSVVRPEAE